MLRLSVSSITVSRRFMNISPKISSRMERVRVRGTDLRNRNTCSIPPHDRLAERHRLIGHAVNRAPEVTRTLILTTAREGEIAGI